MTLLKPPRMVVLSQSKVEGVMWLNHQKCWFVNIRSTPLLTPAINFDIRNQILKKAGHIP